MRAGAQLIVFPELSLTGYEPTLANSLSVDAERPSGCLPLSALQRASDESGATILVGAPTRPRGDSEEGKPCISVLRLSPDAPMDCYSKQYLHADELPFFDPGPIAPNVVSVRRGDSCAGSIRVGLAICFELGVPAHAAAAFGAGAQLYLASVAKHAAGMDAAEKTLTGEQRAPLASLLLAIGLVVICCHVQHFESLILRRRTLF